MMWWLWVLLGLALLVVEMATPGGLFFLFLGLSAVMVGLLAGVGAVRTPSIQWLLFSVLSILALATLRGPLRARLNLKGPARPVDSLVGEAAVALVDIAAGDVGKVELRGSSWSARMVGGGALAKGQRCVVDRVDGLTLWVRPE
jgi:inner membrane protein